MLNRQKSLNKSQQDVVNCKICLGEEEEPKANPMISPCNCTGSMKHIHLQCLQEWLEGKKHMKETPYVNSYIWKGLECEICKFSYNDIITLKDGREVSLLMYNLHEDA
jgi:E3 ubiquitin-protein ligase DOA10